MTHNTYTDEQRTEALTLYTEHGTAEAARLSEISPRTIRRWANENGLAAARDKTLSDAGERLKVQHESMREELRVRFLETALDALDRMTEEHVDYRGKDAKQVTWPMAPAREMKDYATTAAIMVDKYRLEMGESTDRTEHGFEVTINGVDLASLR